MLCLRQDMHYSLKDGLLRLILELKALVLKEPSDKHFIMTMDIERNS